MIFCFLYLYSENFTTVLVPIGPVRRLKDGDDQKVWQKVIYTIETYGGVNSLTRCIARKSDNSTPNAAISHIQHCKAL